MKNFLYLFLGAAMVFAACDEPESPYNEFDELGYGAIPRLVNAPDGVFDFFSPDDSQVTFEVEFYDENNGQNVASYAWDVTYEGADQTIGPVNLTTVNKSEFTTNESGLPGTTITFRLTDVLNALGLSIDDVDGGDNFAFTSTLTKDDGSTFTSANTSPNLIGQPAFNAFFGFDQPLVCPSDLGGTYIANSEGESTDVCCAGTFSSDGREITLTDNGGGNYTISDWSGGLYFAWYGPDGGDYGITEDYIAAGNLNQTIVDACGNYSSPDFTEPFGESASLTNIAVDANGVITYEFSNGYGDMGRVTLTPQ